MEQGEYYYDQAMEGEGRGVDFIVDIFKAADFDNPKAKEEIETIYNYGYDFSGYIDDMNNFLMEMGGDDKGYVLDLLGYIYEFGLGVEINYDTAIEYYQRALENDNPLAANNIGNMYEYGRGVNRNLTEAIKYYQMSVDKGYVMAMTNLSVLYYNSEDYTKAFNYGKMAAERGDVTSTFNLGSMYRLGLGVEKNTKKAIEYYESGLSRDRIAAIYLGNIYFQGDGVDKDYIKAVEYYSSALGNVPDIEEDIKATIRQIDPDGYIREIIQLRKDKKLLEAQVNHLLYRPGGPGAKKAQKEFERLRSQQILHI